MQKRITLLIFVIQLLICFLEDVHITENSFQQKVDLVDKERLSPGHYKFTIIFLFLD